MTRITDSRDDKARFAAAMVRLYKAHLLQPDKEHTAVYHEALKGQLFFEPFEHAVKESLRLDDRFPKIPRLIQLSHTYRIPEQRGDLSRPALDESTMSREAWAQRFEDFMDQLDHMDDQKHSVGDFAKAVEPMKLRVVK